MIKTQGFPSMSHFFREGRKCLHRFLGVLQKLDLEAPENSRLKWSRRSFELRTQDEAVSGCPPAAQPGVAFPRFKTPAPERNFPHCQVTVPLG